MKKGFYRFFAHASQGSHEEITPHPIAPTSRSKKYNHQRDGIETESESEAPRLTRYEKDRLRLGSKKIVAVGYVGMCDRGIDVVNMILEKKLFEAHVERVDKWDLDSFPIDSYHDTESGTVYLYLSTTLHITNALNAYAKVTMKEDEDVFRGNLGYQLEDREYQMIKALLFMFHACHILNFITADRRFDLRIPRLLRTLQLAKQSLNPVLLNYLSTHHPTQALKFNSLYSVGRVLPVLNIIWIGLNSTNIEKLTQNLENQVRTILKRGKFSGTDNTRTPLVMIDPTRCVFVFKLEKDQRNFGELLGLENSSTSDKEIRLTGDTSSQLLKFREHMERQFEYFSRQMLSGKRYILPTSYNWYHACFALETFDWNEEKARSLINPDWQFSENRCAQAFQLVKEQYSQIQDKYPTASALTDAALLTFDVYACGPYQEIYRIKIIEEFKHAKVAATSQDPSSKLVGDRYPMFPITANTPIIEFVVRTTKEEPESIVLEGVALPYVDILTNEVSNDEVGVTKLLHDVASYSEGNVKRTVKRRLYIGYEYETNNKKYFLTNDLLNQYIKKEKTDKKKEKSDKPNLLNSEIPLQMPSFLFTREKSSSTFAALTSIYVYTPASDIAVLFTPRIQTDNEEIFGGINVILARASMTIIGIIPGEKKGRFISCLTVNNMINNK